MAFAEDFSVFFDVDNGFAIDFTYIPKIGAEIAAKGIFDDAYFDASGAEVAIAGSQPRLVYTSAAFATPEYGEAIRIDSTNYTIVGIQPDGTGNTTLILEIADDAC
jgi:hypothetical protein